MANSNGEDKQLTRMAELRKNLKEGERILVPTRRPDGTLRKPIKIRAGYTPQEEVAIYQSKGALLRKKMGLQAPPGYDQADDTKPKTKSAKRNERKKEKRQQAALERCKNLKDLAGYETKMENELFERDRSEFVQNLVSQMTELSVSPAPIAASAPSNPAEDLDTGAPGQDVDKRIRALKKKIRLAEAQQQKTPQQDLKSEQAAKLAKLEGWREHHEIRLKTNLCCFHLQFE